MSRKEVKKLCKSLQVINGAKVEVNIARSFRTFPLFWKPKGNPKIGTAVFGE